MKEEKKKISIQGKPRNTVGSRNPYAFVEHVLGVKIDWEHSSPPAIQRLLQKINEEPFHAAFNDLHGSMPEMVIEEKPKKDVKKQKKSVRGAR